MLLQELRFEVMALTVGHGYVAAAGSESQLEVRRLPPSQHSGAHSGSGVSDSGSGGSDSGSGGTGSGGGRLGLEGGSLFSGPIGGSVNNALHITRGVEGEPETTRDLA